MELRVQEDTLCIKEVIYCSMHCSDIFVIQVTFFNVQTGAPDLCKASLMLRNLSIN